MGRYLISTPAQPKIHRCGALILEGLCEGLPARVDPFPTLPPDEAVALVRGRWCYVLTVGQILERRVGSLRPGPVLVEHRCGEVRTAWPDLPAAKTTKSVIPVETGEIPF